jgi:hypothetical protein
MPAKELSLEDRMVRVVGNLKQTTNQYESYWMYDDDFGALIADRENERRGNVITSQEKRYPSSSHEKNFTQSHWDEPNVLVHLKNEHKNRFRR